jgi:hypothetical protein
MKATTWREPIFIDCELSPFMRLLPSAGTLGKTQARLPDVMPPRL